MNNDILAIVVTYNRIVMLEECITKLCNSETIPDILVIDNHSDDGTEDYLKTVGVKYIRLKSNTGGAGGFYTGIKYAAENAYKYVWIMDDDTMVRSDSLDKLLTAAQQLKNDFGFLCSNVQWIDESPCIMNIPNIIRLDTNIDIENAGKGLLRCNQASFVSMLINVSVVLEVGLPMKEFFIWGDDVEYSDRISQKYRSYFVIDSVVIHKMKSNKPTDIATDNVERIDRYVYLYRNRTYMARKKGSKDKWMNMLFILYQLIKISKAQCHEKNKRIRAVLKGWREGCRFNPVITYVLKK